MDSLPYPDIDFRSPEWGKVREWLAIEQQECYRRISGRDVTERDADYHRGKAGFISTLLDFGIDSAAYNGR